MRIKPTTDNRPPSFSVRSGDASSDTSIPWRLWGLLLSKAGDAFRYTEHGFVIDDPAELESLPMPEDEATTQVLWGWDGFSGGGTFIGGAPSALPASIWDFVFKTFGAPPEGHPLAPLAQGKPANLIQSAGYDPWGNPLRTQHLLTVSQACFRRVLLRQNATSGESPTLYVKHSPSELTAECLIWRHAVLSLMVEKVASFEIEIKSAEAMPPYFGLPELMGAANNDPTLAEELVRQYAPSLDAPIPFSENTLGECTLLWQSQTLPNSPRTTAWINRAVCCRAKVKWTEVNRARQLAIRFTKTSGNERLFLCFGRNPFWISETEESDWAGSMSPFPNWGEQRGWWDGADWALELTDETTFEAFEAFAQSQGMTLAYEGGETDCWLIAYCHELADTPMAFYGEGLHSFQMSWTTILRTAQR